MDRTLNFSSWRRWLLLSSTVLVFLGFQTAHALTTITSVTPDEGPVTGGTTVVLDGEGFYQQVEFTKITTGHSHTCALDVAGKAYCWGSGSDGQLGNNSFAPSVTTPTAVLDPNEVMGGRALVDIVAGASHTCAIDSDGNGYCWGYNFFGQLGDNTTTNRSTPVSIVDVNNVIVGSQFNKISSNGHTTCALDNLGNPYCWGRNQFGGIGDTTTTQRNAPVAVVDNNNLFVGTTLVDISAGRFHTCAVDEDGAASCWGRNTSGQLGNNSTVGSSVPVQVSDTNFSGATVEKIVVSPEEHTCALVSTGTVYCWGNNTYGVLGNNTQVGAIVPTAIVDANAVITGTSIIDVKVGQDLTCALDSDGKVYCWGRNVTGEVGDGTTTLRSAPVAIVDTNAVINTTPIIAISAGGFVGTSGYACAIGQTGQAFCWGGGTSGRLGVGSLTQHTSPVAVLGPEGPVNFTAYVGGEVAIVDSVEEESVTIITPANIAGLADIELVSSQTGSILEEDAFLYRPVVESIVRHTPIGSVTSAETVIFGVEISDSVTNVSVEDFVIDGVGVTGTIAGVQGSGSTYQVTVGNIVGEGTLTLDIDVAHNITGADASLLDHTELVSVRELYTIDSEAPVGDYVFATPAPIINAFRNSEDNYIAVSVHRTGSGSFEGTLTGEANRPFLEVTGVWKDTDANCSNDSNALTPVVGVEEFTEGLHYYCVGYEVNGIVDRDIQPTITVTLESTSNNVSPAVIDTVVEIDVYPLATNIGGTSTNFTALSDLRAVEDPIIEVVGSTRVEWQGTLNVAYQNLDEDMAIGQGFISFNPDAVDTTLLNTPATVTFYGMECTDFDLYYATGFWSSVEEIAANGVLMATAADIGGDCADDTICQAVTCSGGALSFEAQHFDGFGGDSDPAVKSLEVQAVVTEALIMTLNHMGVHFSLDPALGEGQDNSQRTIITVFNNALSGYSIRGELDDGTGSAGLRSLLGHLIPSLSQSAATNNDDYFGYTAFNESTSAVVDGMRSFASESSLLYTDAQGELPVQTTNPTDPISAPAFGGFHTIVYDLNISFLTPAGIYAGTIVYTAIANF